jgi:pimeloyl-ACP methyl ester carboxylesterase
MSERKKLQGICRALILLIVLLGPACAQVAATWQDPSKHQRRFVTVDQGVSLEMLDWGGAGRPILLLTGSGNTAHVFDEFAPKLTDCGHVYGITRRGYGASSRPSSGYDDQRLADDVFQVIEREHLQAPVLVGHSMSGGEMTTLGRQHSNRLGGLVYLDALCDLEDDPPADKEWAAAQQKLPPGLFPQPKCEPIDRSTFSAYRRTLACTMGFAFPESELRNGFESVDGRVGPFKTPDWVSRAIGQAQVFRRDYSNIRVPVLALMNGALTTEEVLSASGYQPKNDSERASIDQFMARSRIVFGRWTDKLKRHVPDARIVYFPLAGHFVFMTREAEVLREIHTFVAGLTSKAK